MMPEQEKAALDRLNGPEKPERIMSDEFDGVDATEKAGIGTALNRCRALASKIANELRNKRPEHFVDKLSLAGVHAVGSARQTAGSARRTVGLSYGSAHRISHRCCGTVRFRSPQLRRQP